MTIMFVSITDACSTFSTSLRKALIILAVLPLLGFCAATLKCFLFIIRLKKFFKQSKNLYKKNVRREDL